MNNRVYKRTKEYIDELRAKKDFDFSNSKPIQPNNKKKFVIKKSKTEPIFNINDVIRISHEKPPPSPRSISNIALELPKKSLVSELSSKMLDIVMKVPILDENGKEKRSERNEIIYKKEKLKDVLYRPVADLMSISKYFKVKNENYKKIIHAIIVDKIDMSKINDTGYLATLGFSSSDIETLKTFTKK